MKRFSIIALTLLLGVACSQNDVVEGYQTVSFSSAPLTRATDSEWAIGDRVGIFAGDESTSAYQYEIQTTDGSIMTPVSTLVQRESGDDNSVNYYAYYPYRSTLTSTTYSVDVTDQSDLSAIDLLWATTTEEGLNVTFGFKHQLVKLIIDFTTSEENLLSSAMVALTNANKTASFDLQTGVLSNYDATGYFFLDVEKVDEYNATITAIVLPMADLNGVYLNILVDGSYEKYEFNSGSSWESGKVYEYEIAISNS